jgi:hypothetical protein
MGIEKVAGALAPAGASPVEPKPSFGKLLQQAKVKDPAPPAAQAAPGVSRVESGARVETAGRILEQVSDAQGRLDRVLELARSGKTFTPAELLGLQAQVYTASQQLDLAGKVVEKATGGVKQILQTQV